MERFTTIINEFLAFVATIPPHWAHLIGAGVAVGLGTSASVAVITYRKKWKEAEKYAKEFIALILMGIAFAMSASIYFVTHTTEITQLFTIPYLADFAKTALPVWGIALGVANKFYELGGSRLYQRFYDNIAPRLSVWAQQRQATKDASAVFQTALPKPYVVVHTTDDEDADIFQSDDTESK